MKEFRKYFFFTFVVLFVLWNASFAQMSRIESTQQLFGFWVNDSEYGFEIIHIINSDSVLVYEYLNREKELGEVDPSLKHYFYFSTGKLLISDNLNSFSIQTQKFRYDFLYQGRLIEEVGKMGIVKSFIKVKEINNLKEDFEE